MHARTQNHRPQNQNLTEEKKNQHMLTVRDLNRFIDSKKNERCVTYHKILEKCMDKIKRCAQMEQYRCVFEVPEILIGEPLYSLKHVIEYVFDKLKNQCGMLVAFYPPRKLYISWNYDEIRDDMNWQNQAIESAMAKALPETLAITHTDHRFHPKMIHQHQPLYSQPSQPHSSSFFSTKKKKHALTNDDDVSEYGETTQHNANRNQAKCRKMIRMEPHHHHHPPPPHPNPPHAIHAIHSHGSLQGSLQEHIQTQSQMIHATKQPNLPQPPPPIPSQWLAFPQASRRVVRASQDMHFGGLAAHHQDDVVSRLGNNNNNNNNNQDTNNGKSAFASMSSFKPSGKFTLNLE
jgi:hypothetical protein